MSQGFFLKGKTGLNRFRLVQLVFLPLLYSYISGFFGLIVPDTWQVHRFPVEPGGPVWFVIN